MTTFGDRIKSERKALGMTQPQLGAKAGVGKSSVSQWETGLTKTIEGLNLLAICKALRVNEEWLLTGEGEKYRRSSKHYSSGDAEKQPQKSEEAIKLFDIIDAADRAMNDSGLTFTDEERLENYFACLDFAGRKHFSSELVNQYLSEMMKFNVSHK
jgi:transcriptional regulator with XRE-family HTH domain